MATVVRINTVDVERLKGSVRIQDAIERRSTASFDVVDRTGTGGYTRGQPIEIITDLAVPPFVKTLFTGYIDSITAKRISPTSDMLYWSVQCIDQHYLADKRIAAESYESKTAGFIADDLFDNYLDPEGVTIGEIQVGPTIEEMVINYQPVSRALDALAARSNFIWYIDKFKQLYFVERTTTPAPFSIVASDFQREAGSILSEVQESNPLYRNRQFLRGARIVTILQTENRTGDGKTASFALGYPLAKVPTVTVAANPQTVGIKGIDDTEDVYWSEGDPIITFDSGSIPGIGLAIVVQYYGYFEPMVQADNVVEQAARQAIEGGTGLVEIMDDEANVRTINDAFALADAKLDKYSVIGKQVLIPLRDWGIEPGQLVTVTNTAYGLTVAELLVESLEIHEVAPEELRYTVRAILGPETGDWTGFFKHLADIRADVLERITVGKDQVLILLAVAKENWDWTEDVDEYIYACPLCADTTIIGDTVLVC